MNEKKKKTDVRLASDLWGVQKHCSGPKISVCKQRIQMIAGVNDAAEKFA